MIPLFGNRLPCAILGEFFESRFDLISQLLFILVHDDDSLIDFEWKEPQQQRWQQISDGHDVFLLEYMIYERLDYGWPSDS